MSTDTFEDAVVSKFSEVAEVSMRAFLRSRKHRKPTAPELKVILKGVAQTIRIALERVKLTPESSPQDFNEVLQAGLQASVGYALLVMGLEPPATSVN